MYQGNTNGNLLIVPKWLLHLLTDDDPEVVTLASKILARHLTVLGPEYVAKFSGKTGGFTIMRHRLKRWWDVPTIWPICFSIMFGQDIASIDLEGPFESSNLLQQFSAGKVRYPELLPVITAMLKSGLTAVLRAQDDPDSPLHEVTNGAGGILSPLMGSHPASMSLEEELLARSK